MKDLLLYRLGGEPSPDAEPALELLRQAAHLPLEDRWPLFGRLDVFLKHPSVEVRRAAVPLLRGAMGQVGFRQIVEMLDDPDRSVRQAATETLYDSASRHDPGRWAHAVFHPDPAVRSASIDAIEKGEKPSPSLLRVALHLLDDPPLRRRMCELLTEHAFPIEGLGLLATILSRQTAADSDRAETESPTDSISADEFRRFARHWIAGSSLSYRTELFELPAEVLTVLLDAIWDEQPGPLPNVPSMVNPSEVFFENSLQTVGQVDKRKELAGPLAAVAARRGWTLRAARLRAVCDPITFVTEETIPPALRRRAIQVFYDLGKRTPLWCRGIPQADWENCNVCRGRIAAALGSSLCRRDNGQLDVWVLGGLMHSLRNFEPYVFLEKIFGRPHIIASCLYNLYETVQFLSVPDEAGAINETDDDILAMTKRNRRARVSLLHDILVKRGNRAGMIHAMMVGLYPVEELNFIESLGSRTLVEMLAAMLDWEKTVSRPLTLTPGKLKLLTGLLDAKLTSNHFRDFFQAWLDRDKPERFPLGIELLAARAARVSAEQLVAWLAPASFWKKEPDTQRLRRLLDVLNHCPGFPYGKECQLAALLASHADPEIQRWAHQRLPVPGPVVEPIALPVASASIWTLSPEEVDRIATAPETGLDTAVEPALAHPIRGLCAALAGRPDPTTFHSGVYVALLGCHDSLLEIDRQTLRFFPTNHALLSRVDAAAVANWQGREKLPLLGDAWLCRWEQHAFAFGKAVAAQPDGFAALFQTILTMRHPVLRQELAGAIRRIFGIWRWRDRQQLQSAVDGPLLEILFKALTDSGVGPTAAAILIKIRDSGVAPEPIRALGERIVPLLPELPEEVRRELRSWIHSRGIVSTVRSRFQPRTEAAPDLLKEIAACDDLDALIDFCRGENGGAAAEAALKILQHWETQGATRLADLLLQSPPVPCAGALVETIGLWPDGEALKRVHRFFHDPVFPAELRFLVGYELLGRENPSARDIDPDELADPRVDALLQLPFLMEETGPWFRQTHWKMLKRIGIPPVHAAVRLAVCEQSGAYLPAVDYLLGLDVLRPAALTALRDFLDCGTERLRSKRIEAAARLHRSGDFTGYPLLVAERFSAGSSRTRSEALPGSSSAMVAGLPAEEVLTLVESVLTAGPKVASEHQVASVVDVASTREMDGRLRDDVLLQIFSEATDRRSRDRCKSAVRRSPSRHGKLRRIAEQFHWGIERGRELSGRLFQIRMTSGEALGYTRLSESTLYITPLPVFRGEPRGGEIVRGLIVHEIGHHLYHAGPEGEKADEEAGKERLHSLLNLVEDEHLERNLRARSSEYGDYLKTLGAWAFLHASRDFQVHYLLDALGTRSFDVLLGVRIHPSRKTGCIRLSGGKVLGELERRGSSFSRFFKALRLGLGNRYNDPKVEQALALFQGNFRGLTPMGLLEIARKLREIFHDEYQILDAFSQSGLEAGDLDDIERSGEAITDAEINAEVIRIRGKPSKAGGRAGKGAPPNPVINVGDDETFDSIDRVVQLPFDPEAYRDYARQVARHARQLQRFFAELGVDHVRDRRRTSGTRLDRSRLRSLPYLRDPRILQSRRLVWTTDLFLGIVIDCSGSMGYGNNILRARQFGALLAEAARGLSGIDVRIFGFTDSLIYDAGDKLRPAVSALEADGGNNDAAGLWYASRVALASRRTAKLLVMISDGLPTECSVAALRGLVDRLTRREGLCCAQVAVRPLEEVCFPDYVELQGETDSQVIRRFGEIVARLVRKAMKR